MEYAYRKVLWIMGVWAIDDGFCSQSMLEDFEVFPQLCGAQDLSWRWSHFVL